MLLAGTATTGRPEFTLDDVETWLTSAQDHPIPPIVGAPPREERHLTIATAVPYCPPG